MSNNDIDRAFIKLKALSQKKGYLLFDDLERGTDGLSLNEVDWVTGSAADTSLTRKMSLRPIWYKEERHV